MEAAQRTAAPSTQPLRVAIVEDDPVVRGHLATEVRAAAGLTLSWHADSLATAKRHLRVPIDVALIDLGLPDGSGAEYIKLLKAHTTTRVLVVTVFDDRGSVLGAIENGADGYLLKDSRSEEILGAITSVVDGGAPLSAAAAVHLTTALRGTGQPKAPISRVKLTNREVEILELFAKGHSYRDVAESLHISRHTVGDFVKSIYRKLGVNSRSGAVFQALQQQLIVLPDRA